MLYGRDNTQIGRHKRRKQAGRQVGRQTEREREREREDMITKNVDCLFKTQSGWSSATLECLSHAKGAIHRPGVIEASKYRIRKYDQML